MKTAEEFVKELQKNQAKTDALKQLSSEEEAKEFIKKEGLSCTVEELGNALGQYMQSGKELSDDELSAVAGGEIKWGSYGRCKSPEEVRFEFNVGDRVEVFDGWFINDITKRGTIKKAYPRRDIEDFSYPYHPAYDIQLDNGSYWYGVIQKRISY